MDSRCIFTWRDREREIDEGNVGETSTAEDMGHVSGSVYYVQWEMRELHKRTKRKVQMKGSKNVN